MMVSMTADGDLEPVVDTSSEVEAGGPRGLRGLRPLAQGVGARRGRHRHRPGPPGRLRSPRRRGRHRGVACRATPPTPISVCGSSSTPTTRPSRSPSCPSRRPSRLPSSPRRWRAAARVATTCRHVARPARATSQRAGVVTARCSRGDAALTSGTSRTYHPEYRTVCPIHQRSCHTMSTLADVDPGRPLGFPVLRGRCPPRLAGPPAPPRPRPLAGRARRPRLLGRHPLRGLRHRQPGLRALQLGRPGDHALRARRGRGRPAEPDDAQHGPAAPHPLPAPGQQGLHPPHGARPRGEHPPLRPTPSSTR